MVVNKYKYVITVALISIIPFGSAHANMKKLPDADLKKIYENAVEETLRAEYRFAKDYVAYCRCTDQNPQNRKKACDRVWDKQFEAGMHEMRTGFHFDTIISEIDRRQEEIDEKRRDWNKDEMMFEIGRRNVYQEMGAEEPIEGYYRHKIIGLEKWFNGLSDLYRQEKKLHLKTTEELFVKENNIRQRYPDQAQQFDAGNYEAAKCRMSMQEQYEYRMNSIKLQAIKLELEARSSMQQNK